MPFQYLSLIRSQLVDDGRGARLKGNSCQCSNQIAVMWIGQLFSQLVAKRDRRWTREIQARKQIQLLRPINRHLPKLGNKGEYKTVNLTRHSPRSVGEATIPISCRTKAPMTSCVQSIQFAGDRRCRALRFSAETFPSVRIAAYLSKVA
jgi:hypothetical protein